jgi:hypothetical protein
MTSGLSRYADVSSVIPDIYEGSLLTLRWQNVLVPTVTVYNDQMGINPRKITVRTSGNLRQVAEGEDVTPTQFNKSLLSTLTPAIYRDQFLITDQDFRTDIESIRDQAVLEMGGGVAENIDTTIASAFTSLTGGTVGAGLGTVTWSQVFAARSILQQQKVKGPYYCVLGAGQWFHLTNAGGTAGSPTTAFTISTEFRDRTINNYFVAAPMGDVTFVVCPNVSGAGGGTAIGAMYSQIALAYDERNPFHINEQYDGSRESTELNYGVEYAAGVWRAVAGVQIKSTDVIPTT